MFLLQRHNRVSKPHSQARIDWSNPHTRGLIGAFYLGYQNRTNLVTGKPVTLEGNASFLPDGVFLPDTTIGDRITTGITSIITDKLTVIARIKPKFPTTTTDYHRIVDATDASGAITQGYRMQYNSDNDDYQFLIYNSVNTNVSLALNNSFENEIITVSGRYDGSELAIFLNGNDKQSIAASGNIQNIKPLVIGNTSVDHALPGWFGDIYDILVFNVDKTDSEIKELSENIHQIVIPENNYIFIPSTAEYLLTMQGISHAHALDNMDLTQANTLAVDESDHNNNIDNVDLIQSLNLQVDDSDVSHLIDNIDLDQTNTLVVDEANHGHSLENPDLSQANVLAVGGMDHGNLLDDVTLNVSVTLALQELLHNHSAGGVALTQQNILELQKLIHNQLMDAPGLVQSNILATDSLDHVFSLDHVTLSSAGFLNVTKLTHLFQMDNVDLGQANILTLQDMNHAHGLDGITLLAGVSLIVQKVDQPHSLDNVTLTQAQLLEVQKAVYSVLFDNPTLNQGSTLAVDGMDHNHLVDGLALTQAATLIVSDALHAHLLDNINFSSGIITTNNERVFVVKRKNRTFIVAKNRPDYFN